MALATCKVLYGVNNACGDIIFPGGADKDWYVGYVSELSSKIPITQLSVVSSLSFQAYTGLVKFSSTKLALKFDWEFVKGAGGNGFYRHTANLKVISLSVQDDVEVQKLLQAQDAFIINKNNNGSYLIYGPSNGFTATAGNGTTGQAFEDDTSDSIVLQAPERTKPLRFLVTDEATTSAYLDARVI